MNCAICLDSIKQVDKNQQAILVCGHEFHPRCILKWFSKNPSCPTCRTKHLKDVDSEKNNEEQIFFSAIDFPIRRSHISVHTGNPLGDDDANSTNSTHTNFQGGIEDSLTSILSGRLEHIYHSPERVDSQNNSSNQDHLPVNVLNSIENTYQSPEIIRRNSRNTFMNAIFQHNEFNQPI